MTRRTFSAALNLRRARLTGAALLTSAAALTLAGCQWTSPVQTDYAYQPADGREVALGNNVTVSNLLVVTDKKGGQGTLVGLGANESEQPVNLTFGVQGSQPVSLEVPAYGSAQLSTPEGKKSTIGTVPAAPGELVSVQIGSPTMGSRTVQVPVVAPYAPYGAYSTSGPITPTPAPTSSAPAAGH